jgi:hypothetical protein
MAAIVDQSASDLTVKALGLIPNCLSLTQFQKLGKEFGEQGQAVKPAET